MCATGTGVVVHNLLEEVELVNSLMWRQNTKMPVVGVRSYKCEASDYGYPKLFSIDF
jgi:hypothetical protein